MPTSISIDRIDPSLGYSFGNIRLVCYQVNTFRGRWTDEQMLAMARAIVAKADADSKEPTWMPYQPGFEVELDCWETVGTA